MAVLKLSDNINKLSFAEIAQIPRNVKADMLSAEGEIVRKAQMDVANAAGLRKTGQMIDSSTAEKPSVNGAGGSVVVTFEGNRTRGGKRRRKGKATTAKVTRNAEIAYLNNYGVKGKNRATHFIDRANEQSADAVAQAGADILHAWQDSQLS